MGRPLAASALLLLAGCTGDSGGGAPVREVTVDTGAPMAEIDERFLSVAVDATQLVGGTFWDPEATDPKTEGTVEVPPYDFARPRLRALASHLAPACLRLGGTEADRIFYDLSDTPVTEAPAGYRWVLDRGMWDGAHDFAQDLGYGVLFTINAGPGPRAGGAWTDGNARTLVEYTAAQGYQVDLWELGNELNAFQLIHGTALSPEQYVADLREMRAMLEEEDPDARVGGPASAFWPEAGEFTPVLADVVALAGTSLDVVTWHYYPQQSRRCPVATRRAGEEVMLDPVNLDEVDTWADLVETARDEGAPAAEVWLGETGNAQCGGEPGVSDAFAGGFWWLDQLGRIARRGQPIMVRQTLSGSNYGLLDDETLDPNPDYWNSLVWKRLMGTRVLDAASPDPLLRVYAHCRRDAAGVVVLALNLGEETLRVQPALPGPAELWRFTADSLGASELEINGVTPLAGADGTLPPLEPVDADDGRFTLPRRSYAFAAYPDAVAPACQ